jgi:membrane fusion protein (multidrug efflux system)
MTEGNERRETQPQASRPTNGNGVHRRRALLLLAVLLLAGFGIGTPYYLNARHFETTDDAFIEGHMIPISTRVAGHVMRVLVQDNEQVKSGQVLVELDPADFQVQLAAAKATLEAAVSRQTAARSGTDVVRITANASVEQAEAGVKMAESAITSAQAAVETSKSRQVEVAAQLAATEAAVAEAQADVAAAAADCSKADADLNRYQELVATKSISQQQLEWATASAKSYAAKLEANRKKVTAAEAQVAQVKAAIQTAAQSVTQAESLLMEAQAKAVQTKAALASAKSAPQQIEVSSAQAAVASADVQQAQAALRQAELNLSYTKIIAPEDGRVTRKSVEAGAYYQVGQAMMALVPSHVWVVANFKETQLNDMRPGQPVDIEVDAYPELKLTGKVDSIQSGTGARFSLLPPENATGNYVKVVQRVPVKIVLDQPPDEAHLLAPGMSVVPRVRVR